MVKKRLKKRVIQDKHFLAFKTMPYMKNIGEVIKWTGDNEPMRYIFDKARRYLVFDKLTCTWQGMNFGNPSRELLSKTPRLRHSTKRIYEKMEKRKLDLLSPQDGGATSYISDWETFKNSELIQTLKHEDQLLKHFVIIAIQQGYIIHDERKKLVGIDYQSIKNGGKTT